MLALTPSERRGAVVLLVLLALGAGRDLWRAWRPPPAPDLAGAEPGGDVDARGAERDAGRDVPPAESGPTGAECAPAPSPPRERAGLDHAIDLNRAGPGELDALPGVGPVLAERIILQRQRYGPFHGLEDLLAVRGVGPSLLDRIRPWAVVLPPRAPAALPSADSLAGAHR